MLETTRHDVLDLGHAVSAGGLLVLLGDPQPEPRHWLQVKPGSEVHFGRAAAEELGVGVLDALHDTPHDPTLSRRHARLVLDEGGAYLVDLGSANGTWLNGRRLASGVPTRLPNGASFQVGASRFAWLDGEAELAPWRDGGPAWLERETFETACLTALVRLQRYERPLALLVVSGDGVLGDGLDTAEPVWLGCVGADDVLGYVGPDEWALLLPESTLPAAHDMADFIRVTAHRWEALAGGESPSRELRIGITAVAHDMALSKVDGHADAGLALDLDSVRLFLAAAREDRDATHGRARQPATIDRPVREVRGADQASTHETP